MLLPAMIVVPWQEPLGAGVSLKKERSRARFLVSMVTAGSKVIFCLFFAFVPAGSFFEQEETPLPRDYQASPRSP